jgi:hypothetical protein
MIQFKCVFGFLLCSSSDGNMYFTTKKELMMMMMIDVSGWIDGLFREGVVG